MSLPNPVVGRLRESVGSQETSSRTGEVPGDHMTGDAGSMLMEEESERILTQSVLKGNNILSGVCPSAETQPSGVE